MADYYTQLSFAVTMPDDHATWCAAVHAAASDLMIGEDHAADQHHNPEHLAVARQIIATGIEYTGVSFDFDQTGLWIHDDESPNVEYIAALLQAYLKHFGITEQCITFEWASTCSKPRLDAYGGGACVVSHDDVKFLNTSSWVYDTVKAMHEKGNQSQ